MEKFYFSQQQAREIKELLDLRLSTNDKEEFRRISSRLRNRGFYISQFNSKFSSLDFDQEVEKGIFIITENPINFQPIINNTQQQYNENPNTMGKSSKSNFNLIILAILAIMWILGTLIQNSDKEPTVTKGSKYNPSYDEQIDDLKRDIKKSDNWVEGITIYDDNCDTIAIVNK